jgi:hypothetical protein
MNTKKLIEKFKPFVNGYVGSSMLTNTEYPETILANSEKCVKILEEFAIEFLDSIREYERENGNKICFDERDSKELLQIYKKGKKL